MAGNSRAVTFGLARRLPVGWNLSDAPADYHPNSISRHLLVASG